MQWVELASLPESVLNGVIWYRTSDLKLIRVIQGSAKDLGINLINLLSETDSQLELRSRSLVISGSPPPASVYDKLKSLGLPLVYLSTNEDVERTIEEEIKFCEHLYYSYRHDQLATHLSQKRMQTNLAENFELGLLYAAAIASKERWPEFSEVISTLKSHPDSNNSLRARILEIEMRLRSDLDQSENASRTVFEESRTIRLAARSHGDLSLLMGLSQRNNAHQSLKQIQQAVKVFSEVGPVGRRLIAQLNESFFLSVLNRLPEALRTAQNAYNEAKSLGYKFVLLRGKSLLIRLSLRSGNLRGINELLEDLSDRNHVSDITSVYAELYLSKFDQMIVTFKRLMESAPNQESFEIYELCYNSAGEWRSGRSDALISDDLVKLTIESDTDYKNVARAVFCELGFQSGFSNTHLEVMEKFLAFKRPASLQYQFSFDFFYAAAMASCGGLDQALRTIAASRGENEANGQGFWAFRSNVLEAQILMRKGQFSNADAALKRARYWEQTYSAQPVLNKELLLTEASLAYLRKDSKTFEFLLKQDQDIKNLFQQNPVSDLHYWIIKRFERLLDQLGVRNKESIRVLTREDEMQMAIRDVPVWQKNFRGFVYDDESQSISYGAKPLKLVPNSLPFDLLKGFMFEPDRAFDKETLTLLFWKEPYNPIVHDARIYTAIRRMRSFAKRNPITSAGRGYRWNPRVPWAVLRKNHTKATTGQAEDQITEYLKLNGSMTRHAISQALGLGASQTKLKVQGLVARGVLIRANRGPATRYRLND